jgi:hypothetical protein
MNRPCLAALCLFITSASAQDKPGLWAPDYSAPMPDGFTKATAALNTVTVTQLNGMSEDHLTEIETLCNHWLRVIGDERKRRVK